MPLATPKRLESEDETFLRLDDRGDAGFLVREVDPAEARAACSADALARAEPAA
jgi:hypothetical protein